MRLGRAATASGARWIIGSKEGWSVPSAPWASVPSIATLLESGAIGTGGEAAIDETIVEQPWSVADLLDPAPRPGKIVAIGLNYVDHALEGKMELPTQPLVFAKFSSSLVGPNAEVRWRRDLTAQVDYEGELAVIIGSRAVEVSEAEALQHAFGYTCLNDVSARDLQFGDGQWVRGKSLDTFCPVGPWIVTADEVPDPQALRIRTRVSGEVRQDAPTSDMVFSVAELISRLSHSFTLEPGDIIATGTPPGVGVFSDPQRFLAHGDVVEVEIDRIGILSNRAVEI